MEGLDEHLVGYLRAQDLNEVSPAALARWLCEQSHLKGPSRPVVFAYFSHSFNLSLGTVMLELGPWIGFDPTGHLLDAAFDAAVRRLVNDEAR